MQRQEATPVDFAKLLTTLVAVANEVKRDDGVKVTLRFEGGGARAFQVPGHDSRLGQIIDNLIENARSFSPPGGTRARHLPAAAQARSKFWSMTTGRACGPTRWKRSSSGFIPTGRIRVLARIPASACRSPSRSSKRMAARSAVENRTGPPGRRRRADGARRPLHRAPAGDVMRRMPVTTVMTDAATVHASAVLVGARAVLIRGPSGAGKSRLALDLIEAGRAGRLRFARLVGDDRVHLESAGGRLLVRPAAALAGLIEVRGVGILRLDHEPCAVVGLVVDLAPRTPSACRQRTATSRSRVSSYRDLPSQRALRPCRRLLALLTSSADGPSRTPSEPRCGHRLPARLAIG